MRNSLLGAAALLAGCGLGTAALRGDDGRLAPCTARNCVSSLASEPAHRVEPLHYTGSRDAARAQLVDILRRLPRTEVISVNDDYVYAQVTTAAMRYVDDVEFVLGPAGTIDLRSASRLGAYDFGVNRERIELIRAMFTGRR